MCTARGVKYAFASKYKMFSITHYDTLKCWYVPFDSENIYMYSLKYGCPVHVLSKLYVPNWCVVWTISGLDGGCPSY